MNKLLSPKFALLLFFALASFGAASAQNAPPPDGAKPPGPQVKRPNLIQLLGLSPEQAQQVRKINQSRKPLMEAATMRLREANRAMDVAIYADTVDESAFQARLKELQAAQAEVARLRFTSELQIRQILTPDQLARFRDLRKQFQSSMPDPNGPPPNQGPRGTDDKNFVRRSVKVP
jgi:Spy/CpxP family protein refolding chaperone